MTPVFKRTGKFLIAVIAVTVMALSGCGNKAANQYQGKKAKYVFFFIGDGMSLPQVSLTAMYLASLDKDIPVEYKNYLNMTQFPVQGFTSTFSKGSYITDSAASGTALSSGYKTANDIIGMTPDNQVPAKTVAEVAKDKGMKVGIVSSVSLDHATPACFYSHQPSRKMLYEISLDMINSGFEYFAGGGLVQPTGIDYRQPHALDLARKNGFTVATNRDMFEKVGKESGKVIVINRYLDEDAATYFEIDRPKDSVSLAEYTRKGIEVLDNPNGFFMMVEGGKIDWACHANDARTAIGDVIAFDQAIAEAIQFFHKHPGETLIVVTGDHETGGLTIGHAQTQYSTYLDRMSRQSMSYITLKQKLKSYYAQHSPSSAKIEDLYPLIKEAYGMTVMDDKAYMALSTRAHMGDKQAKIDAGLVLSKPDLDELKEALFFAMKGLGYVEQNPVAYFRYGTNDPVVITLTRILNRKSGVGWTTTYHTGLPVVTFAMGNGQELFGGMYDTTDIAKKIKNIMGN